VPLLRPILITPVVCLVLLLGLAACGGGDNDAAEPGAGATAPAEGTDTRRGRRSLRPRAAGAATRWQPPMPPGGGGPDLDDLQPSFETVVRQVTNGGGGMPAFEGDLTEKQIRDVAAFVAENAGG
jgi:hypothetical protein